LLCFEQYFLSFDASLRCKLKCCGEVEKTEYKGWKNCYRVTNGDVEVIVTGDVGPRVIRFGFVGGQNLFRNSPNNWEERRRKVPGSRGDRVWKAPEDPVATWAPDNGPIEVQLTPTAGGA